METQNIVPIIGASVRIPKELLHPTDIDQMRRDLTSRVGGKSKYGFGADAHTLMTYDDSGSWMTVPRAYGISAMRNIPALAGLTPVDMTSTGIPTSFDFNEDFQAQRPTMKAIQDRLVGQTVKKLKGGVNGGILCASCGCHAAGERVLMADGITKKAEDVEIGDFLMGIDGPRRVLELHRGRQQMVRVTPKKGVSFIVNLGHILTVMWSVSARGRKDGELIDIPISEWMRSPQNFKSHSVLFRSEVEKFETTYESGDRPIKPYFLGLLLGDGSLKRAPGITTKDDEIVDECYALANCYAGLHIRKDSCGGRCPTYFITSGQRGGGPKHDQNGLVLDLKKLGLWGTSAKTKFIPSAYKYGPTHDRLMVLAGLIDTDGSLTCGCYEFSSASKQLVDDVTFISRSLGFGAYSKPKIVNGTTYWRVFISGKCSTIPVILSRKRCAPRRINKDVRRVGIKSTELLPEDDYYGFVVDGDHRYLMGDFTLTHNTGKTVMGCKIAAKLGTTTLVFAHKEFLVDQWKNRISQWLQMPEDDIGVVQQNRCEYEGRKIVVAMLQSIVERDYPTELYSWPGLVIADEIHRHGAELWHKAALRFMSKYRLGLTATPTRKDGMWDIVRNNFGEILARDSGEAMKPTIYAIRYRPRYSIFQYAWAERLLSGEIRVKRVYLGKFLTLLAKDPDRNKMITDILMKGFREGRKTLLLTDRREHITILKGMIAERDKTVTVGRYVGGMSAKARALSEQCNIILGTFQMACIKTDFPLVNPLTGDTFSVKDVSNGVRNSLVTGCDMFTVAEPAKAAITGKKHVYRISTLGGNSVDCTKDHRLLTHRGWAELGEVTVGDYLVAPRVAIVREQPTELTVSDAYLIGALLGDGSTSQIARGTAGFTNIDSECLAAVNSALRKHGMFLKHAKNGKDYPIRSDKGKLGRGRKTWLRVTCERLDLAHVAVDKHIPLELMLASEAHVRAVLGGLLDTDGSISKRGEVIFSSVSSKLIEQVRFLFLRLGFPILGTPSFSSGAYNILLSAYDSKRFSSITDCMRVSRKRKRLTVNERSGRRGTCGTTNAVPLKFVRVVRDWARSAGMKIKDIVDLCKQQGLSGTFFKYMRPGNLDAIKCVCDALNVQIPFNPAHVFDRVTNIQSIGLHEVGDVSIPISHAFLCGGVIVHNCEALDIPALDAGILATPHADVEQASGRICRMMEGKKQPVLIDIVDEEEHIGTPFFRKREYFYLSRGWPVKYVG